MVHHDVDEDRHEEAENGCTIANLRAVYAAVPG
jgi:hypothetical protein